MHLIFFIVINDNRKKSGNDYSTKFVRLLSLQLTIKILNDIILYCMNIQTSIQMLQATDNIVSICGSWVKMKGSTNTNKQLISATKTETLCR